MTSAGAVGLWRTKRCFFDFMCQCLASVMKRLRFSSQFPKCLTELFDKNFNFFIIYLFTNYNTIINYIVIIYKLSNFDHVLGARCNGNGTDQSLGWESNP